eukprot:COSAG02_NODE_4921_length_4836_cov_2.655478_4_plen_146_part_00
MSGNLAFLGSQPVDSCLAIRLRVSVLEYFGRPDFLARCTGQSPYIESDFFEQTVLGCMSTTTIAQYINGKLEFVTFWGRFLYTRDKIGTISPSFHQGPRLIAHRDKMGTNSLHTGTKSGQFHQIRPEGDYRRISVPSGGFLLISY